MKFIHLFTGICFTQEKMATVEETTDLRWALQAINSGTLAVSFVLPQPTSGGCLRETPNSVELNVTLSQFTHLLKILSTPEQTPASPSLKNVEFHSVDWDPQHVLHLASLLENNPNVQHLTFKRNRFNQHRLSELSLALSKNKTVKQIVLSESSIGSTGAEELSKMIEANSTLELLTIFDSNPVAAATPLISAVLAMNRSTEVQIWSTNPNKKSTKVVEFVPGDSALRLHDTLDISGACRIISSLGMNSTVTTLDMTGLKLDLRSAKEFRWVLEQNRTLREVNLSKTGLKDKGIVYVAAGLFKNRTLEKLYLDRNLFGGVGVEHLLCPLSKFSALQSQANTTLKSVTLGGQGAKIGRDGLAAILRMITSNRSVTHLGIHGDDSLKPESIVKIFECLGRNSTMRCLSLQGCKGVNGEDVLRAIMETLNVNPWIEDIDLARTPLHVTGKTESVYRRLNQNEKSEPEIDFLKDMAMAMPKNCRVFLCGQEYAGKNTLCNSILQNISPSKLPYLDQVRILVNPVEQAVRTPGMSVKTFKDDDGTKISIWNLAGQHEFYSLHDVMFPGQGSASMFLIISSLVRKLKQKTSDEIEQDLQYWLRFIVANSKRAVRQCVLPNITIVLTHHDKTNQQPDNFQDTVNLIQRLKDKFRGFVELSPNVFTVDARSSVSVSTLGRHIRKTSKTILERVPRIYQLCNDVVEILSDWRRGNHNRPTMKWEEFGELCQVKVPYLRIRSRHDNNEKVGTRRKAVARNLHQIGEVIYFDEMRFLILDFEWFCDEVLSQLTKLDVGKQCSTEKNGFVCRKDFEKILRSNVIENLEANDLIELMLKLELCCERDPSDPNSDLLIPSNLEEGRRKPRRWQVDSPDNNYVGRRLQYDESSHMFLTPGFFPRLQVHLHNKIMGSRDPQHGASYGLEKYLIYINVNGIYVRVELGARLGYSVDVIACSAKSPTEILRLFQHLLIPAIQSLCRDVALTEYVIRSECVKNLTPPRYRKNQVIHVQQLKRALLSVPADGIYDYQHTWDSVTDSGSDILGPGFDFARDLLSDDEFREVLHTRYHDLYNLAMELQVTRDDNPDTSASEEITSSVDPTFIGIAKGVEAVLQRLKIIEQEIRDVKREIQGLRYYEHRILIELHRKVNYLVNYNTQQEERKVPNMFYFVRTENYSRRLITTVISGMNALRLHMLCEFRREMHVIEDQIGCETMQVDNVTVKCLAPYMKKFMVLLTFALKIGAHLAVGMGEMIPDLGREVAHLIDSPMIYGSTTAGVAAAAGVAGAAAAGNYNRNSRDVRQDHHGAAQQWLLDFLRDQKCYTGKDIAEKFGLWRVRYRDDGQIAWVCRRHIYARSYEIVEVPI